MTKLLVLSIFLLLLFVQSVIINLGYTYFCEHISPLERGSSNAETSL